MEDSKLIQNHSYIIIAITYGSYNESSTFTLKFWCDLNNLVQNRFDRQNNKKKKFAIRMSDKANL